MSVIENLPRLNKDNQIFAVNEEPPDQYVISVMTTLRAPQKVKANKAIGPDNIPTLGTKEPCRYTRSSINCCFQQINARRRTS